MRNIVIVDASSTGKNYINDIFKCKYHPVILEPHLGKDASPELFEERIQLRKKYGKIAGFFEEKHTYGETLNIIKKLDPVLLIPGGEFGVELATRLAEDVGLPGNAYSNIEKFICKDGMQNALKEYGIRYIRSKIVNSVEDAKKFYNESNMKGCVIKPNRGVSSQGVYLCENEQEMLVAIKKELGKKNLFGEKTKIILQEYIKGTEYIVNTVSSEGNHRLSSVWKYDKRHLKTGENVYESAKLITRLKAKHQQLIQYAFQVADAIGYRYGAIHGEYLVDKNGPVLIEVNCRPMGADMDAEFLDDVLGHHETDNCLSSCLNSVWHKSLIAESYRPHKNACIFNVVLSEDMDVKMWPIIPIVTHLRSFFHYNIKAKSNNLKRTVDLETSPGTVYMKNNDIKILENDIKFLRKLEKKYPRMLFLKENYLENRDIPKNCKSIEKIIEEYHCNQNTVVMTNNNSIKTKVPVINVNKISFSDKKYNWGILDLIWEKNENIESIIENFYSFVSRINRGGYILIPMSTYWHLPYGKKQ